MALSTVSEKSEYLEQSHCTSVLDRSFKSRVTERPENTGANTMLRAGSGHNISRDSAESLNSSGKGKL